MKKSCLIIEANVEMTEELSLLDSIEEIRQKAKERPAEYPIDYTIRLITAMVASHMGYTDRTQWTELLKQCKDSKYSKRLEENRFYLQEYTESEIKNMIREAVILDRRNRKRSMKREIEELKSKIAIVFFYIGLPVLMFLLSILNGQE